MAAVVERLSTWQPLDAYLGGTAMSATSMLWGSQSMAQRSNVTALDALFSALRVVIYQPVDVGRMMQIMLVASRGELAR